MEPTTQDHNILADGDAGDNVILFYGRDNAWGQFSNFYPAVIELDGKIWPTTEHYFQAQKFPDQPALMEKIRKATSPGGAASLGRKRTFPLREDWEDVKENVMRKALRAKFTQHSDLREVLLQTKSAFLVEHTHLDAYWADGGDGRGLNRLGVLLMELRRELEETSLSN
ncbi:hypothetical protein BJ742DRAFT_858297 [Cladochytrium replicatum]|nr:hypothetical protein BJ742DRAFT_858297 [Cladochytrium replicatum]